MNAPDKFKGVVNGLRYDVETATLLAHNNYWNGNNWEQNGRNTFLYRTPNGRYFVVELTQWQGERDQLIPVPKDEATGLWEMLPEHVVEYENAFGGKVVDA